MLTRLRTPLQAVVDHTEVLDSSVGSDSGVYSESDLATMLASVSASRGEPWDVSGVPVDYSFKARLPCRAYFLYLLAWHLAICFVPASHHCSRQYPNSPEDLICLAAAIAGSIRRAEGDPHQARAHRLHC